MSLLSASHIGNLEAVKELLSIVANPNTATRYGNTPLIFASNNGYLEVIKELLRAGADPNLANKGGETPLLFASYSGHLEIVEELENYFPTLFHLSLRLLRKFKIYISSVSFFPI